MPPRAANGSTCWDLETFTVAVHPTDPDHGVRRHRRWRVAQHRSRRHVPARELSRQGQAGLVVPGRLQRPERIYAGGSPVDVYRSDDRGESWRRLPNPGDRDRCTAPFAVRVMRMAQHPEQPDEIYAALEVNGVIRTTDGGETWTDCSADLLRLSELPHLKSKIVSDTFAEGMLDGHAIAISAGRSRRRGPRLPHGPVPHADQGKSWQDMEMKRFSPITYGRDVKVAPQDPKTMYAALASPPPARTAGSTAARMPARPGSASTRCRCTAPSCRSACTTAIPHQVYIGARYEGEVFGTQDGGETWKAMPLPGQVKDIYSVACG